MGRGDEGQPDRQRHHRHPEKQHEMRGEGQKRASLDQDVASGRVSFLALSLPPKGPGWQGLIGE
jgi:hypothetical protein